MIWVFTVMVALLTTIALAGYAGFTLWRSFELTSLSQRNSARVEEISVVLRANLWIDSQGVPRIALGDQASGDRMRLPSWLVGDDRTPWGARYAYCPVAIGQAGTGAESIVSSGPSSSYPVTTVSVHQPGIAGMSYVVGASPDFGYGGSDPSVVGFVVSPAPYANEAPNCESIVNRNGFYVIDATSASSKGTVTAVGARGTVLSSATQGLTSSKFDSVVYVAPGALGDGSGADGGNAMTYGDAYRLWLSVQPRVVTFVFAAGAYQVNPGEGEFRLDAPARVVRFVGTGQTMLASTQGVRFAFDGDASLKGVSFGGATTLVAEPGARLLMQQASVGSLEVDGGAVDVDPSVGLGAVTLRGGTLRFASAATRLQPAPVGSGVVAGAAGPMAALPFTSLAASGGDIVVDGVTVPSSGGAMALTLSGSARVSILDGGALAGATETESMPAPSCDSGDAYGRVTCTISCDPSHPFVRQGACPVTGGLLAAFMRTRDSASGVEGFQCVSRADQPVAQKDVLVPGAAGAAQPLVSTAVDLAAAPGFSPSVSAYCSINP